jgi:serine/threonine-protein kinase RsbW
VFRRSVADDLAEVTPALSWVRELVSTSRLDENLGFAIEVCLEEALGNLVMHGRALAGGKDIEVSFEARDGGARLMISDRCEPFDVSAVDLPPVPSRALAQVGGQGLRLVRAFSGGLTYRTERGRNVLTLTFRSDAMGQS